VLIFKEHTYIILLDSLQFLCNFVQLKSFSLPDWDIDPVPLRSIRHIFFQAICRSKYTPQAVSQVHLKIEKFHQYYLYQTSTMSVNQRPKALPATEVLI